MFVAAILSLLLSLAPGVRPCDKQFKPSCEAYATELAHLTTRVNTVSTIPKELIIAVAFYESGLSRTRHGKLGQGIMGIHPGSPQYLYARILCDLHPDNCLETQIAIASGYLEFEKRKNRCKTIRGALSSYVSGKCDTEAGRIYANQVLKRYRYILREENKRK